MSFDKNKNEIKKKERESKKNKSKRKDLGKAFASRRDTENYSVTPVARIFIKRNAKAM